MFGKTRYLFFLLMALTLTGASCISLGGNKSGMSGPVGVFVSTDKGESWRASSLMPTVEGVKQLTGVGMYRLENDPHDKNTWYWLSRGNGLFYTYDNGKSWNPASAPMNTGFIYSIAIHPKDKCVIYATNGRQIFKTRDCMRTWREVFQELRPAVSIKHLAFNPYEPYDIYVGERNGDLLKSSGNELTYEEQNNSWNVVKRFGTTLSFVMFDTNKQGLMYVALLEDGLQRSSDAGENWEDLKPRFKGFAGALKLRGFQVYPTKADELYWISTYGILKSKNAGTDWEAIDLITPAGSVNIYGFAVNPKNDNEIYYIGTIGEKSTFYKTTDGGKNWVTKKLPSKQLPTVLQVHPENDSMLFLGYAYPPEKK